MANGKELTPTFFASRPLNEPLVADLDGNADKQRTDSGSAQEGVCGEVRLLSQSRPTEASASSSAPHRGILCCLPARLAIMLLTPFLILITIERLIAGGQIIFLALSIVGGLNQAAQV